MTTVSMSYDAFAHLPASTLDQFSSNAKIRSSSVWRCRGEPLSRARKPVCSQQISTLGFQEAIDGDGEGTSQGWASVSSRARARELPLIQTLSQFPKQQLFAKVVLVRFDAAILLRDDLELRNETILNALYTITYLHEAGAKVVLVGDWSGKINSRITSTQSVADILSSLLRLKVSPCQSSSGYLGRYDDGEVILLDNLRKSKGELANSSVFSEKLSDSIDIFVNDAFSQSHKILASTVGVTRFCYSSVAGFDFEDCLYKLKKAAISNCRPYFVIIGGGDFLGKSDALQCLASECDGIIFVGMMSFQVMHALGLHVPLNLVDHKAFQEAKRFVQVALSRRIPIVCPKDFWCTNGHLTQNLELVPYDRLSNGWLPIDIGFESVEEIKALLATCKKLLWTGPVKFKLPSYEFKGASNLVSLLDQLVRQKCDVSIVGSIACQEVKDGSICASSYNMLQNATVSWEYLSGRKLPAVMALDRAQPSDVDWKTSYDDVVKPLVVDIGSGNGKFLLGMARSDNSVNFLGLENNEKLVPQCLHFVRQSGMKNVHFIAANATSTFWSIVSSYPGDLILVCISCPNPDFNKPEHRWRMIQRQLVEAVTEMLKPEGRVFLQSDIEEVAMRMREQFLELSNGKLGVLEKRDGEGEWLKENPFGVHTDWEQHVIDRGNPMYRVCLYKKGDLNLPASSQGDGC